MAQETTSTGLIGRSSEMRALQTSAARAAAGAPGLVLVAGEAGVGKTRLLTSFLDLRRGEGALVTAGSCIEMIEGAVPYAPINHALRQLAKSDAPTLSEPSRTLLGEVLHQAGRHHGTTAPGGAGRGEFFGSVLDLVGLLAAERPLVVAIEDLHWSDSSTRDLVSFVTNGLVDERVLFVATYRSDELHRRHPLRRWIVDMKRRAITTELALAPLTEEGIAAMLAAMDRRGSSPRFLANLAARTQGNPLFAEELLAAAGSGTGSVPTTVRDLVLTRFETLSPQTQAVLRLISASGPPLDHRVIAAASGLPAEAVTRWLREAHDHNVLMFDSDKRITFRHSLMREAIYEDLLPGESEKLHADLARALTAEEPQPSDPLRAVEIAHHWYAASDAARALPASLEGAHISERCFGFAEAQLAYERVLELWDKAPIDVIEGLDRAEILYRAGSCAFFAENPRRALSLLDSALTETDDPSLAGQIHERRGHCLLWEMDDVAQAFAAYDLATELLTRAPATPEQARALAVIAGDYAVKGSFQQARELAFRALASARELDSESEIGAALGAVGDALYLSGDLVPAAPVLRSAMAIRTKTHDPEVTFTISALVDTLGWQRPEHGVAAARSGANDVGGFAPGHMFHSHLACQTAEFLFLAGRWDEVDRITSKTLRSENLPEVEAYARGVRAALATGRGDFATAHELLGRVAELVAVPGLLQTWAPPAVIEAELHLWERAPEKVGPLSARAVDALDQGQPWYTTPLLTLGVRAESEAAQQARAVKDDAALWDAIQRASLLVDRAQAAAGITTARVVAAHAALSEAEFSRVIGAPDPHAFARAAARFEEIGVPYEAAYARFREGEARLVGSGPRAAATVALRAAHAITTDLKAIPLMSEIELLARRARIDLSDEASPTPIVPPAPGSELGLTGRELEVLELVAQGKTNREIAAALFISVKTAGVHVSHILEKLGVSTRVEAAGVAHRIGMLDEPVG